MSYCGSNNNQLTMMSKNTASPLTFHYYIYFIEEFALKIFSYRENSVAGKLSLRYPMKSFIGKIDLLVEYLIRIILVPTEDRQNKFTFLILCQEGSCFPLSS